MEEARAGPVGGGANDGRAGGEGAGGVDEAGGGGAGGEAWRPHVVAARVGEEERLRLAALGRKALRMAAKQAQDDWAAGLCPSLQALVGQDRRWTKCFRRWAGARGLLAAQWLNTWPGMAVALTGWAAFWSSALPAESRTLGLLWAWTVCWTGWGVGWVGRTWVGRPRPPLSLTLGPGCPSGHSVCASLVLGVLGSTCQLGRVSLSLCGAWCFCVGLGRMVQRSHWGLDVVLGWAVGLLWAAGHSALRRILLRTFHCEPHQA